MVLPKLWAAVRAVIVMVGISVGSVVPALACTCPPEASAAAQAEQWDLVATGMVLSTENSERGNAAEIAIHDVLKGEAGETITVSSGPSNPQACGLSYAVDAEVLVLATAQGENQFSNYFCAIPQFSVEAFRTALDPNAAQLAAEEPAPMAEITSPRSGDVITRDLVVEGQVPQEWFVEGSIDGALLIADEVVSDFQLQPAEDGLGAPGFETVNSTIVLQNTEMVDVTLRLSAAGAAGHEARSVSIPVTLLPVPENIEDMEREALIHAKTVTWFTLYAENDAEGLAAFLSDDFVLIGADGSVSTKEDEVAFLSDMGWLAPVDFEYHVDDVIFASQAVAIVYGHATSTRAGSGGLPCQHTYASSNVFRKNGGDWRPVSSHVSSVECVPAP